VIWGDRIFLTTHETGRLAVVALDRPTGTPAWQWAVPAGPTSDVHAASNPAAPSCAADARHAYAYFGSWGLAAFHHDGREAWRRPMPPPRNRYGMATSPVLHGNHVILVLDSDDTRSRIVAFQTADGTTAWETERPGQRATWSTPAIWTPALDSDRPGADELIVLSAMRLAAYDPRDGRELWTLDGFPQETVSVPAIGRDLVYAGAAALGGRGDERYDAMGWKQLLAFDTNADGRVQAAEIPDDFRLVLRPDLPREHPGYAIPFAFKRDFRSRDLDQDGALSESEWNESVLKWEASSRPVLMAVRPGSLPAAGSPTIPPPGTATATSTDSPAAPGASPAHGRVAWKTTRGLPEMPSFLLHQERLFYVRDGGLLSCYEAGTGTLVYQERLGAPGQYCASPVAASNRLYLASVDGVVTVVDTATPALRVLARNAVGGPIHATPALAEDVLYLRTASHLIAFASPGTR
jgi:outer membrane protein assembly factor BamB